MKCSVCGKEIQQDGIFSGYGILNGEKVCYQCCGELDKKALDNLNFGDKIILYFNGKQITNFPATLKITPTRVETKNHNLSGTVNYVWFKFHNKNFLGRQYGKNSELCYIKRLKKNS